MPVTVLHVTHDFEEAIAMGGRMAVMGDGRIRQTGTSDEIFRRPNSEFVARFVMAKNILAGTAVKGVFKVGALEFKTDATLEGECKAAIRPEDIYITRESIENTPNCFPAMITKIVNKGSIFNVTASLPPDLTCLVTRRDLDALGLANGQRVSLGFAPGSVHLFRD